MSSFLDSIRCDSSLFPSVDGGLVVLKSTMSVKEGLVLLSQNGISSAPVIHSSAENEANVHSWFSILDCVVSAAELAKDGAVPEDFFRMHVGQIAPVSTKFVTVANSTILSEALKTMVKEDVHRVAVGLGEKGSGPTQLLSVITDSRAARLLLASASEESSQPWNQTLRERGLVGNREPIFIAKDAPVMQAFEKMRVHNVRSVAIIERDFEDEHVLCGVVSASDLAQVLMSDIKDHIAGSLSLSLLPAELKLSAKEFLQWRDAANANRPPQHPRNLVYATANETVTDALRTMVGNQVHKLFVVSPLMKIIGVVTLHDLIKQYLHEPNAL
jgi:CBS domain-containing protein